MTAKAAVKLRSGEVRPLLVRLLGGLVLYVTTLYRSPAGAYRQEAAAAKERAWYPELGVLGIQEGKSPALKCEVGRLTAAVALL